MEKNAVLAYIPQDANESSEGTRPEFGSNKGKWRAELLQKLKTKKETLRVSFLWCQRESNQ